MRRLKVALMDAAIGVAGMVAALQGSKMVRYRAPTPAERESVEIHAWNAEVDAKRASRKARRGQQQ